MTVGPLVRLWREARRSGRLPDEAARQTALGRVGWRHLVLDAGARTATLAVPGMQLDLGGIAKGYAVDRAAAALRDWGIGSALVNAGGDLYAIGTNADGEPWRIGVRDPNGDGVIATLDVEDRAIATSGDYERAFTFAGRRYHHLLDPRTGRARAVDPDRHQRQQANGGGALP